MVAFEVSYYEPDNMPHLVYLKSVYEPGDENGSELNHSRIIASAIVDVVLRRILRYKGWNRQQALLKIKGYLTGENENGNNKSFEEFSQLRDITAYAILSIFNNISQSNDNIEIYDLSWTFIIDPKSIANGSGGKFPTPSWAGKKRNRPTWEEHEFDGVKVNCAAFAIYWYLKKTKETMPNIIRKSWMLQRELGWGEYVSSGEISKFNEKYPKFKLCILMPPHYRATHRYIGNKYTFDGNNDIIYLYYYHNDKYDTRHYAVVESPLVAVNRDTNYKWCYFCDISFLRSKGHSCESGCVPKLVRKVEYEKCEHCGLFEYPSHLCAHKKCITCQQYFKVGGGGYGIHRCPLVFKDQKDKGHAIFVYDLESRFEVVRSVRRVITEFKLDDDGYYIEGSSEDVAFYDYGLNKHIANLVCLKNMHTGEKWSFFGDDCLEKFLEFCFNYNDGKCILLAHNASGYDVRLLFESANRYVIAEQMDAIMRGSKFMQLNIGSLVFRDVMLQIPGNLKGLAKDFGCENQKGDFPFMFNCVDNYNYSGPIPDLKYFALSNLRTQKQYEDLITWHSNWKGEWNFMTELKKYCENDVDVLCEIAKSYHDVWVSKGIQPWLKPTGAGVVHQYMGKEAWKQIETLHNVPDLKVDPEKYYEWIHDISVNYWWAVLTPYEHFFAHKALRGGRTEVKMPYFKLTDEDKRMGKKILYVDVCSMYPYQQIKHEFPVGVPRVYCWDDRYIPCQNHPLKYFCECSRFAKNVPKINTFIMHKMPTFTVIKDWFGIVCVDLKPPKNMLHPVLVCWSDDMSKCVSTLRPEDHKEIIIGTASLHTCLANGYTLEKIYCYHSYKKGNFWRKPTLSLYLEKMLNSKNAPDESKRDDFVKKWQDVYGEEFGNMIKESWPRWGIYPAKKFVSKIAINSVWGKHAQRVIMPKTFIYDFKHQIPEIEMFFENCANGRKLKNVHPIGEDKVMYNAVDDNVEPNLHNQYLPAAIMVPEYGRLQLWEQMNKLGDRVLYCDTDSIVYVYDPELYNVPIGDMVGDWEIEDICDNVIEEFVAWGPKTYGIKCANGYTSVKAKGVCLKRSTEKLLNFEVLKQGALDFLAHGEMTSSRIPQVNFAWSIKDGMRTILNLKEICIKSNEIKGILKDGYIYPFGYDFT